MISPSPGSGIAGRPCRRESAGPTGAGSGSSAGGTVRMPFVTSRIQRKPKIAARTAPTATTIGLRIRPMKMQAMPTANPTGQMVGVGSCGVP